MAHPHSPGTGTSTGTGTGTDAAHSGHDAHHKFMAHHFESPTQQLEAGKLGMWLFFGARNLVLQRSVLCLRHLPVEPSRNLCLRRSFFRSQNGRHQHGGPHLQQLHHCLGRQGGAAQSKTPGGGLAQHHVGLCRHVFGHQIRGVCP